MHFLNDYQTYLIITKVFNIFLCNFMKILNKIKNKTIKRFILLVLLFSLTIFVCNDFILPWYVNKDGVVSVPNLIGKDTASTMKILDSLKLIMVYSATKTDDRYPAGTVINQNPIPGKIVKPGRRIYIVVSGGEQLVLVPDLLGKSIRDVKFILERNNLELNEINYEPAEEYPPNTVIKQSIEAGSKVKKNSLITLTVSRGKIADSVEVPNLIGMSLKEAEKLLGESGLKIGQIEFHPSMNILPNTVIDQYPRPGDHISWGDPVNLFVTKTGTKKIEKFEY